MNAKRNFKRLLEILTQNFSRERGARLIGRRAQKIERRKRDVAQNKKNDESDAKNDGESIMNDAKVRTVEEKKKRKREKNDDRQRIITERGEEIASEQRSQRPRRTATGAIDSGRFAENARGRKRRQNARIAIDGDEKERGRRDGAQNGETGEGKTRKRHKIPCPFARTVERKPR